MPGAVQHLSKVCTTFDRAVQQLSGGCTTFVGGCTTGQESVQHVRNLYKVLAGAVQHLSEVCTTFSSGCTSFVRRLENVCHEALQRLYISKTSFVVILYNICKAVTFCTTSVHLQPDGVNGKDNDGVN